MGAGEVAMLRKGLGLWLEENEEVGWADVVAAPCESGLKRSRSCGIRDDWLMGSLWIGLLRSQTVLRHYRGFELPGGTRTSAYLKRLAEHPNVKATCSTEELYIDSYER